MDKELILEKLGNYFFKVLDSVSGNIGVAMDKVVEAMPGLYNELLLFIQIEVFITLFLPIGLWIAIYSTYRHVGKNYSDVGKHVKTISFIITVLLMSLNSFLFTSSFKNSLQVFFAPRIYIGKMVIDYFIENKRNEQTININSNDVKEEENMVTRLKKNNSK